MTMKIPSAPPPISPISPASDIKGGGGTPGSPAPPSSVHEMFLKMMGKSCQSILDQGNKAVTDAVNKLKDPGNDPDDPDPDPDDDDS